MNEFYLHPGIIKTGTTFLQEQVFPKLQLSYYHTLDILKTDFVGDKIFLSHETLCRVDYHINKPELLDYDYVILKNLKKLFPDAHIILGVRSEGFIKSLYSRYLLEGCSLSYKEFESRVNPRFVDYMYYVDAVKELFDDVFIYHHEDLKKNNVKVIKDMCDFMGAPVPDYVDKQYNIGLSSQQKKILRMLNKTKYYQLPGTLYLFKKLIKREDEYRVRNHV